MRKIPCFILARKNSKSIKNKNISVLKGLPLIVHTIKYAKKCKLISEVVVSTDDPKVAKISKKYNCFTIFPRPKKLSDDKASSESALKHALNVYEKKKEKIKFLAYLQITEPFRPKNILKQCIKKLLNNKKYDSCFAAFIQYKNFWIEKSNALVRISDKKDRFKPRQIKKPVLREDTGIALVTKTKFVRAGERLGKKVTCIKYSNPKYNIDINTEADLIFARNQKLNI